MKRDDRLSRQLDTAIDETLHFSDHIVLTSYYPARPSHWEAAGRAAVRLSVDVPAPQNYTRYCDLPMSWSARLAGIGGAVAAIGLALFVALFTWKAIYRPIVSTSQPLTVVELRPLASPPEPIREVAPGPVQVEKQEADPKPERDTPPFPLIQLPAPPSAKADLQKPVDIVDPGPPISQTSAPKTVVAPTASRLSSEARPNWEGLILAHRERFRQYPARARAARQQGVVYIRFTMNRAGAVLSSAVMRKSGSFTLDQAALDTLQRAQPLPTIPQDRPDVVELTIPVDFNLR